MNEYTYEVLETGTIKRTDSDGVVWFIPADPANSDYATYCVWAIAEGIMEAPTTPTTKE